MRGRKIGCVIFCFLFMLPLSSCKKDGGGFDLSEEIGVFSREEGSGTRAAFCELLSLFEEGSSADSITQSAVVTNSTAVMLSSVASDKYALGYTSLGSLSGDVKPLKVDGEELSTENIQSGKYKLFRSLNIVFKDTLSPSGVDFISFIMSDIGQKTVAEEGYISVPSKENRPQNNSSGRLVISGSSSVFPIMEKLKEAYERLYDDVFIEIQVSDSSTGIQNTADNTADIGMTSRSLTSSELSSGLEELSIARDGIAIIANKENPIDELSRGEIKEIFEGKISRWEALSKE